MFGRAIVCGLHFGISPCSSMSKCASQKHVHVNVCVCLCARVCVCVCTLLNVLAKLLCVVCMFACINSSESAYDVL